MHPQPPTNTPSNRGPLAQRTCACGRAFQPNVPARLRCFTCAPSRATDRHQPARPPARARKVTDAVRARPAHHRPADPRRPAGHGPRNSPRPPPTMPPTRTATASSASSNTISPAPAPAPADAGRPATGPPSAPPRARRHDAAPHRPASTPPPAHGTFRPLSLSAVGEELPECRRRTARRRAARQHHPLRPCPPRPPPPHRPPLQRPADPCRLRTESQARNTEPAPTPPTANRASVTGNPRIPQQRRSPPRRPH